MIGVRIVDFPKILDERGSLSVIENGSLLPFDIAACAWVYDLRDGEEWTGRRLSDSDELVVALSGGFDVIVEDGSEQETYHLNRPYRALYVPEGVGWRIAGFSTNSVVLILSAGEMKSGAMHNPDSDFYKNQVVGLNNVKYAQGKVTIVNGCNDIPFDIKRAYYLYDVPADESRGSHAHKELRQLVIAVSGSFHVTLDDGMEKHTYTLSRPGEALRVTPGMWRTLDGFSSGAVCLVLASDVYTAEDYIRDYDEFLEFKKLK